MYVKNRSKVITTSSVGDVGVQYERNPQEVYSQNAHTLLQLCVGDMGV